MNSGFRPIGDHGGWSPRYNADGFVNTSGKYPHRVYTQLFRDGIVEAVQADVVSTYRDLRIIAGKRVEKELLEGIPSYANALKALDVSPPVFVLISFFGVGNVSIACGSGTETSLPPPLNSNVLTLPICVFEDYGNDAFYRVRVKPALDALWNAGGRHEWPG